MAGFVYFTPKLGGIGQFEAAGLGYAFEGPPAMTEIGPALGPSSLPGMVYHASGEGVPGRITWHLMAPHWWVGHAAGHKPTPADLAKPSKLVSLGYSLRLGDGQDWMVPVAVPCTERDPKRTAGLPMVYKLATGAEVPEGQPIPGFLLPTAGVRLAVANEYTHLVDMAQAFLANLEGNLSDDGDRPAPIGQVETLNFCTELLAVSYRVRIHECIALGLFTQETVNEIVFAGIDAGEIFAAAAAKLGQLAEATA